MYLTAKAPAPKKPAAVAAKKSSSSEDSSDSEDEAPAKTAAKVWKLHVVCMSMCGMTARMIFFLNLDLVHFLYRSLQL